MPEETAKNYTLPYFQSSIHRGFEHYGNELKRKIILSHDEEAVLGLENYLANMLAGFVIPQRISKKPGSKMRDEYIFDLIDQAGKSDIPSVRISIYDHAGKLSLFTAAIIPDSLRRTPLRPNDYTGFAHHAYLNIRAEQSNLSGNAAPVYGVLANETGKIVDLLRDIAEEDINMNGKVNGRLLLNLDQIAGKEERPYDILDELDIILNNLK
jgi:hypothetical protein